jgi:hypothetical protein
MRRYEYITTVFSVTRQKTVQGTFRKVKSASTIQHHTNFAFLYASQSDAGFGFEYICAGHTYKSADGEYRAGFVPAKQFVDVYEEYYNIIKPYEKHILNRAKRGDFSLKSIAHFPDAISSANRGKFQNELDASRIVIKLFTVTFMSTLLNVHNKTNSLHVNAGFNDAMFDTEDITKFQEIMKKQDMTQFGKLISRFRAIRTGGASTKLTTVCGQKIIPLRAKELEDLENIRYDTWREIYIGQRVGDLVVNCISPNFPIFKDYMLIHANPEYAKDFYDNAVNHIKMDHSGAATTIVRDLEKVRRDTFVIDPFKKKELYVSYKFEGLSNAIEIPMDYAEKNLVMADYAVCMINENVGRTFGDMPNVLRGPRMQHRIGPIFKNFALFSKYIFEYVYGLYCANYHLGVIHTDLHVNNVTTFDKVRLVNPETGVVYPPNTNPHIIYDVHDEYYVFPHTGRYGSIIDFSRGIISEEKLHEQFPKRTAHGIVEKEKKRILQKYESLLPDFYRDNESALKAAIEEKFPVVFKLFTAVDMFIFSQGAAQMVRMQILNDPTRLKAYGDQSIIEKKMLPLLEKIREIAFDQLTSKMFKVFSARTADISVDDVEWANHRIIRECFHHSRVDAYDPTVEKSIFTNESVATVELVDYYSIDNPLKYNTREYENFPPISKLDYIIEHKLPLFEVGIANWKKHLEYLSEEDMEQKSNKIREQAKEEKKKRRGVDTKPTKKDKERIKKEPGFTSDDIYYDT